MKTKDLPKGASCVFEGACATGIRVRILAREQNPQAFGEDADEHRATSVDTAAAMGGW